MNGTIPQYAEVKHSMIHPRFLHTNSTSHRWAFSAIAELIDNAQDDAGASQYVQEPWKGFCDGILSRYIRTCTASTIVDLV
jgi:hypothetical protein